MNCKGRTLSVLSSTQVQFDPDLSSAHDLRRWYLEEGMQMEMIDLSIQPKTHDNGSFISIYSFIFSSTRIFLSLVPWKTFSQLLIYDSNMLSNNNGEIFRIKAVCTYARHDPVYKACTRSDCKKKLQDNNDGTYYCSKCELNYEDYKLLYMASVSHKLDYFNFLLLYLFSFVIKDSLVGFDWLSMGEFLRQRMRNSIWLYIGTIST